MVVLGFRLHVNVMSKYQDFIWSAKSIGGHHEDSLSC